MVQPNFAKAQLPVVLIPFRKFSGAFHHNTRFSAATLADTPLRVTLYSLNLGDWHQCVDGYLGNVVPGRFSDTETDLLKHFREYRRPIAPGEFKQVANVAIKLCREVQL